MGRYRAMSKRSASSSASESSLDAMSNAHHRSLQVVPPCAGSVIGDAGVGRLFGMCPMS